MCKFLIKAILVAAAAHVGLGQGVSQPKTDHGIKVTFLGTSTLLIDDSKDQVLIDGFFSRPAAKRLLTKISTDTNLVDEMLRDFQMDRVAAIFVSHSHYDHAMDAAYVAGKTDAILYGSESTLNVGRGGGLDQKQLRLFDLKAIVKFQGFTVQVVKSKHPPVPRYRDDLGVEIEKPLKQPVFALDYAEGGSYDFLITYRGRTIYIKPSAEYLDDGLVDRPAKIDLLFLGTGGMSKRGKAWKAKYYDETIGKLAPSVVVPIHWDNFLKPFSRKLPTARSAGNKYIASKIAKKSKDSKFTVLDGGQSVVLFADGEVREL